MISIMKWVDNKDQRSESSSLGRLFLRFFLDSPPASAAADASCFFLYYSNLISSNIWAY